MSRNRLRVIVVLFGLALVGNGCKTNPTSATADDSPDLNQDGTVGVSELIEFVEGPELSFAHIRPGTSEVYLSFRPDFEPATLRAVLSGPSVDEPRAQILQMDENGHFRVVWTVHEFGTYTAGIGTTNGNGAFLWTGSIVVQ